MQNDTRGAEPIARSPPASYAMHRHSSSESVLPGIPSPNGGFSPTPPGASLERTASLLARSIAMAKLTGTAPPTPPSRFYSLQDFATGRFASGELPTLGALRERAALRRNNTVTGVGSSKGATDIGEENGAKSPETAPSNERAEARVNLMRKLSSRRLEGPSSRDQPVRSVTHASGKFAASEEDGRRQHALPSPEYVQPSLAVVGRLGRARPRSGSIGSRDWNRTPVSVGYDKKDADEKEVMQDAYVPQIGLPKLSLRSPLSASFATDYSSTSGEPKITTEQSPIGYDDGRRKSDASTGSSAADPPSGTTHSRLNVSGDSLSKLPASIPTAFRRGSIPSHLLTSTFGIAAVEESDDNMRRRGSSTSSSVVFGDPNRKGSTADTSLVGLGVDARLLGSGSSVSSPSAGLIIATGPLSASSGEEDPMSKWEQVPSTLPQGVSTPRNQDMKGDDDDWSLKQKRLVAKVERKREEAIAIRGKEGASYTLPEDEYQFPSPTVGTGVRNKSPRMTGDSRGSWRSDSQNTYNPFQAVSPSLLLERQSGQSPLLIESDIASQVTEPAQISPTSHAPHVDDKGQDTSVTRASITNGVSMAALKGLSSPPPRQSDINRLIKSSPQTGSFAMTKQQSFDSQKTSHVSSTVLIPKSPSGSIHSNYSSSTEMKREVSDNSVDSFILSVKERLPEHELPKNKILAKLDSILGTVELESIKPTPLDRPPRRLLLEVPVLQVVNAQTVKDRHLFLFTDLLLIAKPIIEDDPNTNQPQPSTLSSRFIVKSVVPLKELKIAASEDHMDEPPMPKKRHPLLVAFIDKFANDPQRAIASLITKGGLTNDAPTIANLLFRNTDLNRNQVGKYLCDPHNRPVLRSYLDRFRLAGVRVDDALRMLLLSIRLPQEPEAQKYLLTIFASHWTETNTVTGFDPSLTYSLLKSVLHLNETLYSGTEPNGDADTLLSVDDFIASWRQKDPRCFVPEDLLARIYSTIRKEQLHFATDNSEFSATPDIEATIEPAKLNSNLIYRTPSEPITITIPEVDAKLGIKLHGNDLRFDPQYLSFAKSNSQTFRVTGTALGARAMAIIKYGANAPKYHGLPLNKAFSIQRAFMQHTFQIAFVNHLDVKRKYLFSTPDKLTRSMWIRALRERISACAKLSPPSKSFSIGQEVAIQVLREALIAPEDSVLAAPASAASPRPNTAAPRFGGLSTVNSPRILQLGTPSRAPAGATLPRSNSISRLYSAGVGRLESDLNQERKGSIHTRTASQEDALTVAAAVGARSGHDIIMTVEQNSLLPLVLSFLSAGAAEAPHPVSTHGSAFQLPPLPPHAS